MLLLSQMLVKDVTLVLQQIVLHVVQLPLLEKDNVIIVLLEKEIIKQTEIKTLHVLIASIPTVNYVKLIMLHVPNVILLTTHQELVLVLHVLLLIIAQLVQKLTNVILALLLEF